MPYGLGDRVPTMTAQSAKGLGFAITSGRAFDRRIAADNGERRETTPFRRAKSCATAASRRRRKKAADDAETNRAGANAMYQRFSPFDKNSFKCMS
jgi:hypothetical protein